MTPVPHMNEWGGRRGEKASNRQDVRQRWIAQTNDAAMQNRFEKIWIDPVADVPHADKIGKANWGESIVDFLLRISSKHRMRFPNKASAAILEQA